MDNLDSDIIVGEFDTFLMNNGDCTQEDREIAIELFYEFIEEITRE